MLLFKNQGCIRERQIGNRWIPNRATWKHEGSRVLKDVEVKSILMLPGLPCRSFDRTGTAGLPRGRGSIGSRFLAKITRPQSEK